MFGIRHGRIHGLHKGPERLDPVTDAAAEQRADFVIAPFMHVIERSFQDFPFGGIAAVVENDDNRRLPVPETGREFGPGHLKRAVADQDQGSQGRIGEACPKRGRDAEPHGGIVGRRKKFSAFSHAQVRGGEERFTHVGDDHGVFVQQPVQVADHILEGDGRVRCRRFKRAEIRSGQGTGQERGQRGRRKPPDEVLESHAFVAVMLDDN